MKKILFLFALTAAFAFNAQSQSRQFSLLSQYSVSVDTVDNTETLYLSLPSGTSVAGYFKSGTIVFKSQEISGDGSGAVATLEVSANGTDYAAIPTLSAYTLANVTTVQTTAWRVTDLAVKSFRIKVVGAGTMSYKIYGAAFIAN